MKVVVYKPDFLIWESLSPTHRFHGYMSAFVELYADYIFAPGIRQAYRYQKALAKLGIRKKLKYIYRMEALNARTDVLVGFSIPYQEGEFLKAYRGLKVFHTTDYYMHPRETQAYLSSVDADAVIGHCQLDAHCAFFRQMYPEFIGKTISLPFGYAERFAVTKDFDDRINKAVGLGSINPVRDPMVSDSDTKDFVAYFKGEAYQHPLRYYLRENRECYTDCIDALFPGGTQQKDFSYDAVQMLNSYRMFINDEGLSNFPPARTFEGIACGCVMVASDNPIYTDLGFIPGVNYIAFSKGDYEDLGRKLRYYIAHPEELRAIQEASVKLAEHFTHQEVARMLYQKLESLATEKSARRRDEHEQW